MINSSFFPTGSLPGPRPCELFSTGRAGARTVRGLAIGRDHPQNRAALNESGDPVSPRRTILLPVLGKAEVRCPRRSGNRSTAGNVRGSFRLIGRPGTTAKRSLPLVCNQLPPASAASHDLARRLCISHTPHHLHLPPTDDACAPSPVGLSLRLRRECLSRSRA